LFSFNKLWSALLAVKSLNQAPLRN